MIHPFPHPRPAPPPVLAAAAAKPLPPHLAAIRDRLKTLATPAGVLPLGAAIDAHLPLDQTGRRGLPLASLHELAGTGTEVQDAALPAAFTARIVAGLPSRNAILWLSPTDDLYPLGLPETLDPARLILARPRTDADTLGAAETALREGGFAAVILEAGRVDRTQSRRLALACQHASTTAFLIRRFPHGRAGADREALAIATRWLLAPAPSAAVARDEPGPPRLLATLTHARGGRPGTWLLEAAPDATHPFRVVAPLAADPAEHGAAEQRRRA